jgi:2-haloacid dehalogenase
MTLDGVLALTFDTGGTVLDWHSGFRNALAEAGARHGIERDWGQLANELRRRSLRSMINAGEHQPPTHNLDDAHRDCLDDLLSDEDLAAFDADDRRRIAWDAPHSFTAWHDVPDGLAGIRSHVPAVCFSILSYRLIIDSSRRNNLTWDAVLSCEGIGIYKLLPEAYRRAAALLQLAPEQCCMVAAHPMDLDAARSVGFKTVYVRRPDEWGSIEDTPPAPEPGTYDLQVEGLDEVAAALAHTRA